MMLHWTFVCRHSSLTNLTEGGILIPENGLQSQQCRAVSHQMLLTD